jgi:allantoicase
MFYSGAPALLSEVELDTNHFIGNFPESCEIHALRTFPDFDWTSSLPEETKWTLILPRTKLGAHRQHYFELENVEEQIYTHVKVTIFPDGGLKRIRLIGRKMVAEVLSVETDVEQHVQTSSVSSSSTHKSQITTIPVVPLTSEGFDPFGHVIQAYDEDSNPKGIKTTPANEGTATKFHKLSLLAESYAPEAGATTGISVYRCKPLEGVTNGAAVLKTLERHPFTSQAFIPMGRGDKLSDTGDKYLVVVAHNGADDRPDMKSLKAFLATSAQGISYNKGVWRKWSSKL